MLLSPPTVIPPPIQAWPTVNYALTLGGLNLASGPYALVTTADGYEPDFGQPMEATAVADSLLQDGSLVVHRRDDNRTIKFVVGVAGPDLQAIAQSEANLALQLEQRNTLVWQPPTVNGVQPPVSVFDVMTSTMRFISNGMREMVCLRFFEVTIVALPYVRSLSSVVSSVVPAVPPTVTYVFSDGTTTTGWRSPGSSTATATNPAAPTEVSTPTASVQMPHYYTSSTGQISWLWQADFPGAGATQNVWSGMFLSIQMLPPAGFTAPTTPIRLRINGSTAESPTGVYTGFLNPISVSAPDSHGFVTYTWQVPPGFYFTGPEGFEFDSGPSGWTAPAGTADASIQIKNFELSQYPTGTLYGVQQMAIASVPGSQRTAGSLRVKENHNTIATSLPAGVPFTAGFQAIYTCKDGLASGYQPNLRQYETPAPATDTSSPYSGFVPFGGHLAVPASSLPRGGYVLMGFLRDDDVTGSKPSPITFTVTAQIGTTGPKQTIKTTVPYRLSLDGTKWTVQGAVNLGSMLLPPADVPMNSTATVNITISSTAPGSRGYLDEVWAFYMGDNAALTTLTSGIISGGYTFLDAPDLNYPYPRVRVGTSQDGHDSVDASAYLSSFGHHEYNPPTTRLFIVGGNADTGSGLIHYPRWHSNAAS